MVRSRRPKSEKNEKSSQDNEPKKTFNEETHSDFASIAVLLVLYTLQGIPMGLSSSIPFLLQEKVGYAEQATFSLVSWPFSLKLLWAPIVDSIYSKSFGRRKSWLIPVQLLCSILMIFGGSFVGSILDMEEPNVHALTGFFFVLYALMATQDIAVDGWALTMLHPKNVGYASTCNSVGQTLGYFIAYVGFLALHDPSTCDSYFRSIPNPTQGLVTLPGFMGFWGYVMFATTLFIWFFKHEKPEDSESLTIADTYRQMLSVLRLPSVLSLTAILLTCKVAFAATDAVSPLKLVEYGLKKEKMAMLTPILVPLGILLPVYLSQKIKKAEPLQLFVYGIPFRLLVGILYALIVVATPTVMSHHEDVHYYYYIFILGAGALHEVAANMMYVPQMAFFAQVSDPSIGGTYMTYLNTISNLGSKWPNSLSLAFVDAWTTQICSADAENACTNHHAKVDCEALEGHCSMIQDGYFTEVAFCTIFGVIWLIVFYQRLVKLQHLPISAWRVQSS
ncbi:acetyl-coenzyme A transporter [Thraustotheca clavata]|uniref:Acetyl-coenzyme A transporter n=1 Tax=Thraustotheca clavata TaxID=74557 RepID=A0A1V9ZXM0_9STRA|nr:acetyl-coenzyme A transporter [Thraustotheca clavata]